MHASPPVSPHTAGGPRVLVDGLWLTLMRDEHIAAAVDVRALLQSEEVEEPPYWMHLWPGAAALARVVARAPEIRAGCRVLELGCGLGLPSIVAAVRGATVLTTDWKHEPLRLAVRSARRNGCCIRAVQMDFCDAAVRGPFDVLLGAEVGYDEKQVPSLIEVTRHLLRPGGVAWFSDSVNAYRTSLVDGLRTAGLCVAVHQRREYEEGRPVWVRRIEARHP